MNELSQNPLPCPANTVQFKKQPKRKSIRKAAVKCVLRIGFVLIAAAAVPAGILIGIIYLIIKAMDFLIGKMR
ncbi:MAG: hypothetical protein J1F03_03975 [Oscillospiraceae bacterium]|nr:hypothetical protein [Oscillospiraceae bacterium]